MKPQPMNTQNMGHNMGQNMEQYQGGMQFGGNIAQGFFGNQF